MQGKNQKGVDAPDEAAPTARIGLSLKALFRRVFSGRTARMESLEKNSVLRVYPQIPVITAEMTLPISFVVIRFSDEYTHNFFRSESAQEPLNEVIEVDNTSNLYYNNLSRAIAAGLERAHNDIVVVVHEDVLLLDGWQSQFQQTLHQLEEHDPAWGMLGSVGWNASGEFIGHWSDPHQFKNTFKDSQCDFQEAVKLDEQLLIFHRDRVPNLDGNLPGIHFLGEDLQHELARIGLKCYAVNAPTIHKYADKEGQIIISSNQSEKISDRESATYLADEACCKDYIRWKYPNLFSPADAVVASRSLGANQISQSRQPVIVVCKGELESALFHKIAWDTGVFFPGESGEESELMIPLYKMIIEKFRCHAPWQSGNTADTLQSSVAQMLGGLAPGQPWGFVFPESILVLPELRDVFPSARYVYFQRDPLAICLGETHRTARLDNHIGRIALPEAYRYLGMSRARILDDDALDHMVHTTLHQLELMNQHQLAQVGIGSELLTLRFEDFLENPASAMERFSRWLGGSKCSGAIAPLEIEECLKVPKDRYPTARISAAAEKLVRIRETLGYI
tara:strand:+ start:27050 stop:28744 length:1695 start_codon:yes stop_codon:yes gene_type:complete